MKKVPACDKLQMNNIVLIFYDIGPSAKEALPQLNELLSSPERAYTGYVLSALLSIGDPAAIPHIRPFLKSKEFRVAVTAAQALTALKDNDSFDEMAALVPEEPTKENDQANYVCDLLNALYDMNPEKAKPIVEKTAKHPVMAGHRRIIKGLDE
jgi:HEAT repeat protein